MQCGFTAVYENVLLGAEQKENLKAEAHGGVCDTGGFTDDDIALIERVDVDGLVLEVDFGE